MESLPGLAAMRDFPDEEHVIACGSCLGPDKSAPTRKLLQRLKLE
jgi:hypothetical protein